MKRILTRKRASIDDDSHSHCTLYLPFKRAEPPLKRKRCHSPVVKSRSKSRPEEDSRKTKCAKPIPIENAAKPSSQPVIAIARKPIVPYSESEDSEDGEKELIGKPAKRRRLQQSTTSTGGGEPICCPQTKCSWATKRDGGGVARLRQHEKLHESGEGKIACDQGCHEIYFQSAAALTTHRRKEHNLDTKPARRRRPTARSEIVPTASDRRPSTEETDVNICYIRDCRESIVGRKAYEAHIRLLHEPSADKPFRCERGCQKMYFSDEASREEHYITGPRHAIVTAPRETLTARPNSVIAPNTSLCPTCHKSFARESLTEHEFLTHNPDHEHVCEHGCEQWAYATKLLLDNHLLSVHINGRVRHIDLTKKVMVFDCSVCQRTFDLADECKVHMTEQHMCEVVTFPCRVAGCPHAIDHFVDAKARDAHYEMVHRTVVVKDGVTDSVIDLTFESSVPIADDEDNTVIKRTVDQLVDSVVAQEGNKARSMPPRHAMIGRHVTRAREIADVDHPHITCTPPDGEEGEKILYMYRRQNAKERQRRVAAENKTKKARLDRWPLKVWRPLPEEDDELQIVRVVAYNPSKCVLQLVDNLLDAVCVVDGMGVANMQKIGWSANSMFNQSARSVYTKWLCRQNIGQCPIVYRCLLPSCANVIPFPSMGDLEEHMRSRHNVVVCPPQRRIGGVMRRRRTARESAVTNMSTPSSLPPSTPRSSRRSTDMSTDKDYLPPQSPCLADEVDCSEIIPLPPSTPARRSRRKRSAVQYAEETPEVEDVEEQIEVLVIDLDGDQMVVPSVVTTAMVVPSVVTTAMVVPSVVSTAVHIEPISCTPSTSTAVDRSQLREEEVMASGGRKKVHTANQRSFTCQRGCPSKSYISSRTLQKHYRLEHAPPPVLKKTTEMGVPVGLRAHSSARPATPPVSLPIAAHTPLIDLSHTSAPLLLPLHNFICGHPACGSAGDQRFTSVAKLQAHHRRWHPSNSYPMRELRTRHIMGALMNRRPTKHRTPPLTRMTSTVSSNRIDKSFDIMPDDCFEDSVEESAREAPSETEPTLPQSTAVENDAEEDVAPHPTTEPMCPELFQSSTHSTCGKTEAGEDESQSLTTEAPVLNCKPDPTVDLAAGDVLEIGSVSSIDSYQSIRVHVGREVQHMSSTPPSTSTDHLLPPPRKEYGDPPRLPVPEFDALDFASLNMSTVRIYLRPAVKYIYGGQICTAQCLLVRRLSCVMRRCNSVTGRHETRLIQQLLGVCRAVEILKTDKTPSATYLCHASIISCVLGVTDALPLLLSSLHALIRHTFKCRWMSHCRQLCYLAMQHSPSPALKENLEQMLALLAKIAVSKGETIKKDLVDRLQKPIIL